MSIVDEIPKGQVDADIGDSITSLSVSEKETGHNWNQ
jgi:hypothetical protein